MRFRRSLLLLSLLTMTAVAAGCAYSEDTPPVLKEDKKDGLPLPGKTPETGETVTGGTTTGGGGSGPCVPTTCATKGKNCGEIDNGCGKKLACGSCTGSSTCVDNVCGVKPGSPCTETDTDFCKRFGKTCGSHTAENICKELRTVTCGGACPVLDTTPPSVTTTVPVKDAKDVAVTGTGTTIKVTFSEPVKKDSLTMTLSGADGTIAFNTEATEATFTLKSGTKLSLLTKYTVTVKAGLKDTAGNQLVADYVWSFTTRDGKWQTASDLSSDTWKSDTMSSPYVAMNSGGSHTIVWKTTKGLEKTILAIASSTLSPVATASGASNVEMPRIGIDDAGNGVVVWRQFDSGLSKYQIKTLNTDPAKSVLGEGTTPALAVDGSGKAMVVWVDNTVTPHNIRARRLEGVGKEWSGTSGISFFSSTLSAPQITADGKGNFLAVLARQRTDKAETTIYSSLFSGTGNPPSWSPTLVSAEVSLSSNPQVASDGNGNFIVVWQQIDGTASSIYARLMKGGIPDPAVLPVKLSDGGKDSSNAHVAMNRSGEAVAIWNQKNGGDVDVYASRYSKAAWLPPMKLNGTSVPGTQTSKVVLDDSGNAMAIWKECDATPDVTFLCMKAGRISATEPTTLKAEKIDSLSDLGSGDPRLAIDSGGKIIAVWEQAMGAVDTKYHVYWRRFE